MTDERDQKRIEEVRKLLWALKKEYNITDEEFEKAAENIIDSNNTLRVEVDKEGKCTRVLKPSAKKHQNTPKMPTRYAEDDEGFFHE